MNVVSFLRSALIPVIAFLIFGAAIAERALEPKPDAIFENQPAVPERIVSSTTPIVPAKTDDKKISVAVSSKETLPARIVLPPPPPLEKYAEIPNKDLAATDSPGIIVPVPQPPLDEDEIMRAVVRIRCGKVYGSGFAINSEGLVLTAAHVLINAIENGVSECDVIFPKKHGDFGYYSETYFRPGEILMPEAVEKFYKEKGFDVAALRAGTVPDDPVFSQGFPFVRYSFCQLPTLGDKVLLFGYAANIGTSITSLGSVLSRFEGDALQYADVHGVRKEPSDIFPGGFDYVPDYSFTLNELYKHPIVIIASSNNFSGASGGLVFNADQRCILGVNSAVGTAPGDARVFGFIYNFLFPEIKNWFDELKKQQF